jgi:predicted nucleic acid-binding protein
MSGKTFIDTNVLIYAHNTDAGAKHQIAKTVLRNLWSERTGVLSLSSSRRRSFKDFFSPKKVTSPAAAITAIENSDVV